MTQMMKALAKTGPVEGLELIDAPIPSPGDEDVLIRVHRAAVCGTDIHIWNWDEWSQKNVPTPMITGHEFSGEIVAIGKDVDRRLKVGQRVSAEGHVIDLNSEAARAGQRADSITSPSTAPIVTIAECEESLRSAPGSRCVPERRVARP